MTFQHYQNGWLAYIISGIFILLFCWRISRGMPHWLRYPLLCLGAAWLFTPFPIETGHEFMAPAFLMFMYEGLFMPKIGFVRTGPTVASVGLVSLFIYPVLQLVLLPVKSLFSPKTDASDKKEPTAESPQQTLPLGPKKTRIEPSM